MRKKIIKVGNSYAITIAKDFLKKQNLKAGDEVEVKTNSKLGIFTLRTTKSHADTSITPEFKNWVDTYIKENKMLLEKLATS
ncbi:hypothetical protein COV24_02750 [candidate division WWE3 bacterium CG10_big_fil_rev_8_21_14_0_10_32_10]|uniref:SpoVT-AbrB domain-containing protein n=1 Tax=candidate division WWE3 bacterium CG10_big_fil_rev_8_21_14_0_10_32_10 TaxID=1975090 RepID=A0A2H0RC81_UNCKA|nr:MAG: hypothetical protein COV24_02750 [candidate division WWE3 bacterium CG10_big_fil_rev_8_21_14_0_10_32_10]